MSFNDNTRNMSGNTKEGRSGAGYGAKGPTLGKGLACEPCRNRKVRCDGLSTCTPCARINIECYYVPRVRPSFTSSALEARIQDLENKLKALTEASETDSLDSRPGLGLSGLNLASDSGISIGAESEELSESDRDQLLGVFFREKHHCACHLDHNELHSLLSHPNPMERPHPALVYSMVLLGLNFAELFPQPPDFILSDSVPSSATILARVHSSLNDSIAHADRILDHLQASALLMHWYYRQGRLLEGHYQLVATSRLAVACRLHAINYDVIQEMSPAHSPPLVGQSFWDGTVLGRPGSKAELDRRIMVFWSIYFHDIMSTCATGLTSGLDGPGSTVITTVWPHPLEDYFTDSDHLLGGSTISGLFNGIPVSVVVRDMLLVSVLKSTALLERANRLVNQALAKSSSNNAVSPASLQLLEQAINNQIPKLHPITGIPPSDQITPLIRMQLVLIYSCTTLSHLSAYLATIQLHRAREVLAMNVPGSHNAVASHLSRLGAARLALSVIQQVITNVEHIGHSKLEGANGVEHISLYNGFLLIPVLTVLKEERDRCNFEGLPVLDAERELQTCLNILRRMTCVTPPLQVEIDRVLQLSVTV